MDKQSWNLLMAGKLQESELQPLRESVYSDAVAFLDRQKDAVLQWYHRYNRDQLFREREEEVLRQELRRQGVDMPEPNTSGFFGKIRGWLNRIGNATLRKIAQYLLYLIEPTLGRANNPLVLDIVLLGCAVLCAGTGAFVLAGVFLSMKMAMKGTRDVFQQITGHEYQPESQQEQIANILNG
jgi:hypothetical protein